MLVVDTGIELARTSDDPGGGHWEFDENRVTESFHPRGADVGDQDGDEPSHGTGVTGIIAARRTSADVPESVREFNFHGIAWGARTHVMAVSLGTVGPVYDPITVMELTNQDAANAQMLATGLGHRFGGRGRPDVVNMSFGYNGLIHKYTDMQLRTAWTQTLPVLAQSGVHERDRSILVYSAGNDHGLDCNDDPVLLGDSCDSGKVKADSPSVTGGAMARLAELRPHTVTVVATDRTGSIADFSNRCGIAAKWCIAAPGSWMLSAYWGDDWEDRRNDADRNPIPGTGTPGVLGYAASFHGTSFAAPVVSGGLAVVMHYFRGELGNTEALARILKTASQRDEAAPDPVESGEDCPSHLDTDGNPTACELSSTHGRGILDLNAATSPVGTLSTAGAPLGATRMHTPRAWGDIATRMGGIELAAFDTLNAPFWTRLGDRIAPQGGRRRGPRGSQRSANAAERRRRAGLAWLGRPRLGGVGRSRRSPSRSRTTEQKRRKPGASRSRPTGWGPEPCCAGGRCSKTDSSSANGEKAPSLADNTNSYSDRPRRRSRSGRGKRSR